MQGENSGRGESLDVKIRGNISDCCTKDNISERDDDVVAVTLRSQLSWELVMEGGGTY